MDYKLLNIEDVIMHENSIKKYLNEILTQTFDRKIDVIEIEEKYQNIKKFIEDKTAIFIGSFDFGKLIGFLWAYKINTNFEERLHVNYLIVDEKYRSKGIGSKLVSFLKNIAKEKNIKKVELIVSSQNKEAIKFYKKYDFFEERIIMCKNLTD